MILAEAQGYSAFNQQNTLLAKVTSRDVQRDELKAISNVKGESLQSELKCRTITCLI
jgi:hypothetical protein